MNTVILILILKTNLNPPQIFLRRIFYYKKIKGDEMIRIDNLKVHIKEDMDLIDIIKKKYKFLKDDIISYEIIKKSLDARRGEIYYIFNVAIEVKNQSKILEKKIKNISEYKKVNYEFNIVPKNNNKKPVIVGFGPAGMFAALTMVSCGVKPIIVEMGKEIKEREYDVNEFWNNGILNENSNVQFGEGGAGTFSDGKLTTQVKDKRRVKVLEELVNAGAPKEILYLSKPHIGTDILKKVVKNIRKKIISLGGEFLFSSKLTDINIKDNKLDSIVINNNREIETNTLVLAIGHSSRDTFNMIHNKKIPIEKKPFSVGVRIEHPQILIDKIQYGKYYNNKNLKPSEYKLSFHGKSGFSAYSFCMCPGGLVIGSSSEKNTIVTNGMSNYKRSAENANSALLVGIDNKVLNSPNVLEGIDFQRKLESKAFEMGGENYNSPVQLLGDFMKNRTSTKIGKVKPSYKPGYELTNLNDLFPDFISETLKEGILNFNKKMHGFDLKDAVLTGVETRSSSPIRIIRNKDSESLVDGIFPSGEGAGYAGGIMSAAIDGIKTSENLLAKYFDVNYPPLKS